MANFFKTWIFGSLSEYYKKNDTYKDVDGKGLLERYLECFGMELDENIMPFIDNFINLVDLEKVDDKFLPDLSYILGAPPTMGFNNSQYRKLLAYAIAIYKIKGTEKSFQILFSFLGYDVFVIEEIPKKKVTYDSDFIYDEEPEPEIYDTDCAWCSDFKLGIRPSNASQDDLNNFNIGIELNLIANNLVNFIKPINAIYTGLVKSIPINDEIALEVSDKNVEPTII